MKNVVGIVFSCGHLHTQYIKQEFTGYTEDKQAHSVIFDDDEIQLDIPLDPPIVVDGWRIVPLTYPRVFNVISDHVT